MLPKPQKQPDGLDGRVLGEDEQPTAQPQSSRSAQLAESVNKLRDLPFYVENHFFARGNQIQFEFDIAPPPCGVEKPEALDEFRQDQKLARMRPSELPA